LRKITTESGGVDSEDEAAETKMRPSRRGVLRRAQSSYPGGRRAPSTAARTGVKVFGPASAGEGIKMMVAVAAGVAVGNFDVRQA